MTLSVQEWQALLIGASLALMAFAGLQWAAQSVHERLEAGRRIRIARERSERALRGGFASVPDGNHGENVHTASNGSNTGAVSINPPHSSFTNSADAGAAGSLQSTPVGEEKMFNRNSLVKLGSIGALVATATAEANATLPASLATAIEAYQTDATTALGLIMGAGVVIWGLIKLKSKLGW